MIASEDFDARIADAVIAMLDQFGKEKYDENRAVRRDPGEQRNYLKQHVGVSVRRDPDGQLIVRPMHRERSGSIGTDVDAIVLSAEEARQKLTSAIAEAFRRAT